MFGAFDISGSALTAQRQRLDVIASNIANVNTTKGENGKDPYRKKFVIMEPQRTESGGAGVRVADVREDMSEFNLKHEPNHPQANANGDVAYPNVNLSVEYVDAIVATRAYEANVTAIETTKSIYNSTLRLMA